MGIPRDEFVPLGTRKQEDIAKRLRQMLFRSRTRPGERLPAERTLAEQLGVSRPTLRNVLRAFEERGLIVAHEKRGWVITEQAAASREVGVSDTVLVFCRPIHQASPIGTTGVGLDRFVMLGAVDQLHLAGRKVLSLVWDKRVDPSEIAAVRPAGAILFRDPGHEKLSERIAEKLIEQQIPTVIYGQSALSEYFDTVESDHEAGARLVVRALAKRGVKRLLVGWQTADTQQNAWHERRDRGLREEAEACGISIDWSIPLLQPDSDPPSRADFDKHVRLLAGYLAEAMTSQSPPDGIVALNDQLAVSMREATRVFGSLETPTPIFAGYDANFEDLPVRDFTDLSPPDITVDKQNPRVGSTLVEQLEQRISGLAEPPRFTQIPPSLVEVHSNP